MKKLLGFTLIELLVVLVIISIVAGVAVITINSNQHKQYETLAQQLVNTITLAEQEAMLRPAILSLVLTTHEFQFFILKNDKKTQKKNWELLNEHSLKPHAIPSHIQVTLKINDEVVPVDGKYHLMITPSNDLVPFVIFIGKIDEAPYYQVIGKANGEVTYDRVQEK